MGIWVLISIEDQDSNQDYMKVTQIWDFGIDFFLGSRSQESDLDWRFGYWFLFRSQIIR